MQSFTILSNRKIKKDAIYIIVSVKERATSTILAVARSGIRQVQDRLKSSRNLNLKLGKIKDAGKSFEAEILKKKNDLADKAFIDIGTGRIWSAY
jgi:hypothetical protein